MAAPPAPQASRMTGRVAPDRSTDMNRIRMLGVILLVVVVAYTAAWFWAAGQISGYAKGLETADAVTTPRLKCGSFGVGGFPFGFDLSCTSATVTLADTTVTLS
eukprot:gene10610-14220_t